MIKTIKILLYSEIVLILATIVIVLYVTPENYSSLPHFIQGFYTGVTGSSHGLSDYNNDFILGSKFVFPIIGTILPLIAIHKKSKVLRIISMVLLGLFVISYLAGGYFAVVSTVIFILLFTKPVKKYFGYSMGEKEDRKQTDLKTVETLIKNGADLKKEYNIDFFFVGEKENLHKLAQILIQQGYKISKDQEEGELHVDQDIKLELMKSPLITESLESLALENGVKFDGWGTVAN